MAVADLGFDALGSTPDGATPCPHSEWAGAGVFDSNSRGGYAGYVMLSARRRLNVQYGVLLSGDLVCFLLFAVLGLRSHESGITPETLLRAAGPFVAGWFVVVFALGVKRRDEVSLSRGVLRAWVPACALGLIIRTLAFDRDLEVTFAIVSLLVIGVLLMIWRGILAPLVLRVIR